MIEHVGLRAMKLACRVRGLRALPRLTLAAIGSHSDAKGRGAWPSIGLLAEETGSSEKSVRRAVQVLEAVGVLTVRRHGYLNSNEYEIQIRALEAMPMIAEVAEEIGHHDRTLDGEQARHGVPTVTDSDAESGQGDRTVRSHGPDSAVTVTAKGLLNGSGRDQASPADADASVSSSTSEKQTTL